MDILNTEHNKAKRTNDLSNKESAENFSAKLCAPVFICSLIFLVLSYAIDFVYFKRVPHNIGEATAVSSVLTELGSIIKTTTFVLVTVGIGFKRGGILTLPASLIGGILAASGSTVNSISGNLAGISGIFGCMLAGFSSAFYVNLLKKYIFKTTEKEISRILCYIISSTFCTPTVTTIIWAEHAPS